MSEDPKTTGLIKVDFGIMARNIMSKEVEINKLRAENERLTALIARLKEDGERLANKNTAVIYNDDGSVTCAFCDNEVDRRLMCNIPSCPITLHRLLMAEIESEYE